MTKRIGVFHPGPWISGGSERAALAAAVALAPGNEVTVLTFYPPEPARAAELLGMDLGGIRFVRWPFLPDRDLSVLTSGLDVFVNVSPWHFIAPKSRCSLFLVYFPPRLRFGAPRTGLRRVVSGIRDCLPRVLYGEGFDPVAPTGAGWAGGRARLVLPLTHWPGRRRLRVWVSGHAGRPVPEVVLASGGRAVTARSGLDEEVRLELDLDASGPTDAWLEAKGEVSARVQAHIVGPAACVCRRLFPPGSTRSRRLEGVCTDALDAVRRYTRVFAYSRFSKDVMDRTWGVPSAVLYPPVDTSRFPPGKKRPIILSVGRFGRGGNNKRHLVLIEAFRLLMKGGLQGWELHLAGAVSRDRYNAPYFRQVQQAAWGLPITIHGDAPFEQLVELYGAATLYWHACGHGLDERRNPAHAEHFGITTVEAMAAGCVPMVVPKGGQPEIVEEGVSGLFWNEPHELAAKTRSLIADPPTIAHLSLMARERSRLFDRERHDRTLRSIVEGLLVGPARP